MMRFPVTVCVAVLLTACTSGNSVIEVANGSGFSRTELVNVPCPDYAFRIEREDGAEISYQLTADGRVLFEAEVDANSVAHYKFVAGEPTVKADTVATGRLHPERLDDFCWENDRAAYRAYGPALQAKGERAFGYDVWTKKVTYPVAEQRYYNNVVLKIPYHEDLGDGMDAYTVGPTLGGGTSALLDSVGAIVYPWAFAKAETLENGPLRVSFRLTYPPVFIEQDTVTEVRTITLDKGADLNRTVVEYRGISRPRRAVAGIVVHAQNPEGYTLFPTEKMMVYEDLTDSPSPDHGTIFIGLIAPYADSLRYEPLAKPAGDAIGHILAEHTIRPGDSLVYSWGSGWSGGFVRDTAAWIDLMRRASASPFEITLK